MASPRQQYLNSLNWTELRALGKKYPDVGGGGTRSRIEAGLMKCEINIPSDFVATPRPAGRDTTSNTMVANSATTTRPQNKRKAEAEDSGLGGPSKRPGHLVVPPSAGREDMPANSGPTTRSSRKRKIPEAPDFERPNKRLHVASPPAQAPSTPTQSTHRPITINSLLCSENIHPHSRLSQGPSARFPPSVPTVVGVAGTSGTFHQHADPLPAIRLGGNYEPEPRSNNSAFRPGGAVPMVDGRYEFGHWRSNSHDDGIYQRGDNESSRTPLRQDRKGKGKQIHANIQKEADETAERQILLASESMSEIRKGVEPVVFLSAAARTLDASRTSPSSRSQQPRAGPGSPPLDEVYHELEENRAYVVERLWDALKCAYTEDPAARPVPQLVLDLLQERREEREANVYDGTSNRGGRLR